QANAAVIVDEVPPSSWGPYTTAGRIGGIAAWSWLAWIIVAAVVLGIVVAAIVLLVNRQAILRRGEHSV
ncbi:MAG: hypothetical protein JXA93_12330, partial [Anaerolineae bacterium]|nr:hypothetical protein [Anaerolineae bacterium]